MTVISNEVLEKNVFLFSLMKSNDASDFSFDSFSQSIDDAHFHTIIFCKRHWFKGENAACDVNNLSYCFKFSKIYCC